jgi:hypothetical protein
VFRSSQDSLAKEKERAHNLEGRIVGLVMAAALMVLVMLLISKVCRNSRLITSSMKLQLKKARKRHWLKHSSHVQLKSGSKRMKRKESAF